jgi:CHAT domain-containing protein
LLVIIPTYQLYGLPYHALLDGEEPLIERARIVYGHSLDLLCKSLEGDGEAVSGLARGLICGQSRFAHPDYEPLTYVEEEIRAIRGAALMTPDCLVNEELTGSTLVDWARTRRLASYDWLHFATHTCYDNATGAFTGLLLGQDAVDIGEILTWHIKARLVTLSACQTGLGKWHYGDEIAGLVQALLSAGAQTVVASLWLARDRQVPDLMADFYGGMAQGQPPSFALARAQRLAHRSGVDPYDWAPWTLFGHS